MKLDLWKCDRCGIYGDGRGGVRVGGEQPLGWRVFSWIGHGVTDSGSWSLCGDCTGVVIGVIENMEASPLQR